MLQRESCRLRPIEERDLAQVLQWRNSARVRENMFQDHVISWEEHSNWFKGLSKKADRLFLVFELDHKPAGLLYFTDINYEVGSANWGFYIGETDAPQGAGRAMGFTGLTYAFESLKLKMIVGEVLHFNERSIRFHEALGFTKVADGAFKKKLKGGRLEEVAEFRLSAGEWSSKNAKIERDIFNRKESIH